MAEYMDISRFDDWNDLSIIDDDGCAKYVYDVGELPRANVVEKEMILDFIGDNRPTDIQTDWERGCAYICDEIEKLLM